MKASLALLSALALFVPRAYGQEMAWRAGVTITDLVIVCKTAEAAADVAAAEERDGIMAGYTMLRLKTSERVCGAWEVPFTPKALMSEHTTARGVWRVIAVDIGGTTVYALTTASLGDPI